MQAALDFGVPVYQARTLGYRSPVWSSSPNDLERLAMDYIDECPDAWRLFCRFAFEAISAGRQRIGAKLIGERMRWESMIGAGRQPFKLNNNCTTYLARAFVRAYPQHASLFKFRGAGDVLGDL